MKLKVPTKIEIKESPGKGLGVFAIESIIKGEIIEECHLITLPFFDARGRKVLPDYRFNWPMKDPIKFILPLGYGGCYNHNDNNNTYWRKHPEYEAFQFYAVKDINPGEELLIYYGNKDYWDQQSSETILIQ